GQRPISDFDQVKRRLDRLIRGEMPEMQPWTNHDIRRAVRTNLGAIPQIPHDVAELVVAHVPDRLTRTYNLHGYRAEKRQALELWGERLARIVEPDAGTGVQLRRPLCPSRCGPPRGGRCFLRSAGPVMWRRSPPASPSSNSGRIGSWAFCGRTVATP